MASLWNLQAVCWPKLNRFPPAGLYLPSQCMTSDWVCAERWADGRQTRAASRLINPQTPSPSARLVTVISFCHYLNQTLDFLQEGVIQAREPTFRNFAQLSKVNDCFCLSKLSMCVYLCQWSHLCFCIFSTYSETRDSNSKHFLSVKKIKK